MKQGGGRKKGNRFELKVAKLIGMWWHGKPFRRVPCSGGWDKKMAPGDVMSEDADFPFSIECKNRMNWTMETILRGSCSEFNSWWKQCLEDASHSGKWPMLIFKRNQIPEYIAVWEYQWDKLVEAGAECSPFARYMIVHQPVPSHVDKPPHSAVRIMRLDKFLKVVSPEIVKLATE